MRKILSPMLLVITNKENQERGGEYQLIWNSALSPEQQELPACSSSPVTHQCPCKYFGCANHGGN